MWFLRIITANGNQNVTKMLEKVQTRRTAQQSPFYSLIRKIFSKNHTKLEH